MRRLLLLRIAEEFLGAKLVEGFEIGDKGTPGLHCDVAPNELLFVNVDLVLLPVLFQDLHAMMGKMNLLCFA